MATFTIMADGHCSTPAGFRAAGVIAGLKRSGAPDMALLMSDTPAIAAGAFTQNAFAAAPVVLDKEILHRGQPVRAVLVNSGCANACTGGLGMANARKMADHAVAMLGVAAGEVLVSSTGRIGVHMPMEKIFAGTAAAARALSTAGGVDAARAIMTTDTRPKSIAVSLTVGGREVRIGGMSKGAGMIAPHLKSMKALHATMLAYVTTDAAVAPGFLQTCLDASLDASFNRITVDGDTSTNDTFIALANGAAGNAPLDAKHPDAAAFREAFIFVVGHLAKEMVLDGEGVTRFVELVVSGAKDDAQARKCAEAIANSLLVKTAWFGADPNWGRILCAAGYSGVEVNTAKTSLDYGDVAVVRNGMDAGTPEAKQVEAIKKREFQIRLNLGAGSGTFTIWTCDLSYEYVKINADYHT